MSLIVQKYGGTSVGTPERIHAVADRIMRARKAGHSLAVVVSAMGHTTDELIELAYKVSRHPSHREMDMLLTAGERISMALLSMALADREVPAVSFTGSQSGIITDGSHRRARIKRILGDRVRASLAEGKVVIVAGFQGVSESKEITTLGRGGSDTTAVALAAALKAEACEIYTDVNGVYSADPRIVPEAKLWKRIPHHLMLELASRGAGVLHPRCVELARDFGVKLVTRSSLNDLDGTEIVSLMEAQMEEFKITGITSDTGKMLVTVKLMRASVLNSVLSMASQAHLSVIAPIFSGLSAQFFAERDAEAEWRKHLEKLVVDGFVASYELGMDQVPISVIGTRFSQDGRAVQEVMETLAGENISVTMGAASALALTVAVPATHVADGVRALHRRFL